MMEPVPTVHTDNDRSAEREWMVREQIVARGIRDPRVLEAMRRVPRHRFVPALREARTHAYEDGAQGIEEGQTISQPFVVALMSEALQLTGTEKVLEIGSGSGYQTAILSLLANQVVAIERHTLLARRAQAVLEEFGATNVQLLIGDGSQGWDAEAPYDAILVAANAPDVPEALLAQLAPGGRLILPVGPEYPPQRLLLLKKTVDNTLTTRDMGEVAFVPLIGVHGFGLPDDLGVMDV